MKYLTFHESSIKDRDTYKVCLLGKNMRRTELLQSYFNIDSASAIKDNVVAIQLPNSETKLNTQDKRQFFAEEIIKVITHFGTTHIICTDSDWFKALTGTTKVTASRGYLLECKNCPGVKITYVPPVANKFYEPTRFTEAVDAAFTAVLAGLEGTYTDPGKSIVETAYYATEPNKAKFLFDELKKFLSDNPRTKITCDIETFGLRVGQAGIGTIAFGINKHSGFAVAIDLSDYKSAMRQLLKDFFESCKDICHWVFHKASFDVTMLVYELWMDQDICNTEGLHKGLETLLPDAHWDDTLLIAYLATNTTATNELSLKDLSRPFCGNFSVVDVADITQIPQDELLVYNLVDTLRTHYVLETYFPKMIQDQQGELYEGLFKDTQKNNIRMQLTGLPVDMNRVIEVTESMEADYSRFINNMGSNPLIVELNQKIKENYVTKKNNTYKKKSITLADVPEDIKFNPNSHLGLLFYETHSLPVLARTDSGLPSVDADTIKKLKNHITDPLMLDFIKNLLDYKAVEKMLTTFMPALRNAVKGSDENYYLLGYLNLGGTVSGRLSASDPNLTNLPASGTPYGEDFKSCISAPPGWIFCGIDFDSLEDKISALTTKDPNKLAIYLRGYDGHSFRAKAYWPDKMPDIVEGDVVSINSIDKKYPGFRQDSKPPTFALTYGGTFITLMRNCGFSEEEAKAIEANYHKLYKVSDEWVASKIEEATKTGYVTVAFGLRIRTPKLKQVIRGNSKTPYLAEAEARTAGNALGQSWCLLNCRAGNEVVKKSIEQKKYNDIKPCIQIHDAQYYLVRDTVDNLKWINDVSVTAALWQDDPNIYHPTVKLGGKMGVFYPSWAEEIKIKPFDTVEGLQNTIEKALLRKTV